MRSTGWCTALALLLAAPAARAQDVDPRDDALPGAPPFEKRIHLVLDYQGPPGCAEPKLFQDALHFMVGRWDPWRALTPWPVRVRVTVNPAGKGLDGEGWLHDRESVEHWHRAFTGPDCYDILRNVALGVKNTMLAASLTPSPAVACSAAVPATTESREPAAAPPPCTASTREVSGFRDDWQLRGPEPNKPAPPERLPVALRFGLGFRPVDFVADGFSTVGLTAEVGFRYRWGSLGVEAHGDPVLGSASVPNVGLVKFARVSSELLLCAHPFAWLAACGVGDVGRLLFPDHGAWLPVWALYTAIGARAGIEAPVPRVPNLFVRLAVDMLSPVNRPRFSTMTGPIFQATAPAGGIGLSMLLEVPPT